MQLLSDKSNPKEHPAVQLTAKAREQRASQSLLQSLEKDYSVLNSSYKRLAQSHDMLVMELLRHLTFLRNFSGKQLEPQAVSQMLAQFSQFLPSDEVKPPDIALKANGQYFLITDYEARAL